MKPSYIVNIILYIHLSLSFSHSASRSLTHSLKHTFTLMLTIFFNLSVQLIVLQCKRIYSINQNLNGSCDQFLTTFQPSSYSMRTIYYCSLFVIMIVAVTKKKQLKKSYTNLSKITVKHWYIPIFRKLATERSRRKQFSILISFYRSRVFDCIFQSQICFFS